MAETEKAADTAVSYACPFCGKVSNTVSRGNHLGMHRRQGDTPLAINGEVVEREDGLWDVVLTLDSGDNVFVPVNYKGRATKASATFAMKRLIQKIVYGTGAPTTAKVKTKTTKQRGAPGTAFGEDLPSTPEVTAEQILTAFTKLAGVKSIPINMVKTLSDWADLTKTLIEGVRS